MAGAESFSNRLLPGERILWSGHPGTGIMLTPRDMFLIPFSIFWCGFVIFWIVGVLTQGGGWFALFGVLMLAFGLFFMVGRFFIDAWLRGGTQYGLTDKRVLILRQRPTSDFTAVSLERLPQAQISEGRGGIGTVRFGERTSLFAFGRSGLSIWTPSLDPTPQFLAIPNAREVFDLVQQTASRG